MKNLYCCPALRNAVLFFIMTMSEQSLSQELKEMFANKQLQLDTSLTNNCEKWKTKRSGTTKVFFGPFKIVEATKRSPKTLSRHKGNDALFWNTRSTEKSHSVSLTVFYKNMDSVFVELLYVTTEERHGRSILGEVAFGSKDPEEKHSTDCKEMTIKLPGDSSLWLFVPSIIHPDNDTSVTDYFGKLTSVSDTILIKYAKGFEGLNKLWKDYPTGIIFTKENKALGALQFYYDKYVWLTTMADEKTKMVIGAFIAAYMTMGNISP